MSEISVFRHLALQLQIVVRCSQARDELNLMLIHAWEAHEGFLKPVLALNVEYNVVVGAFLHSLRPDSR
jgi:hypothetical protein